MIAKGEIKEVKKGTAKAKFVTDDELKALRSGGTAKPGALEAGEVGTWKVQNSPAKKITGDELTPDHIPSRAALVAKEASLGRKLTPAEAKAINDEGVTIATKHSIHKDGRTWFNKNTKDQISLTPRISRRRAQRY